MFRANFFELVHYWTQHSDGSSYLWTYENFRWIWLQHHATRLYDLKYWAMKLKVDRRTGGYHRFYRCLCNGHAGTPQLIDHVDADPGRSLEFFGEMEKRSLLLRLRDSLFPKESREERDKKDDIFPIRFRTRRDKETCKMYTSYWRSMQSKGPSLRESGSDKDFLSRRRMQCESDGDSVSECDEGGSDFDECSEQEGEGSEQEGEGSEQEGEGSEQEGEGSDEEGECSEEEGDGSEQEDEEGRGDNACADDDQNDDDSTLWQLKEKEKIISRTLIQYAFAGTVPYYESPPERGDEDL
ncbi:unnamed protein product [Amoebophrya sp. A25]|nr:unnamed protein product [Amoebophrya sp. A25]|eukprot:GSA25T00012633001.1